MKKLPLTILATLSLFLFALPADALHLCAKADLKGADPTQPKNNSPIKLREQCKSPKEVSIGTTEQLSALQQPKSWRCEPAIGATLADGIGVAACPSGSLPKVRSWPQEGGGPPGVYFVGAFCPPGIAIDQINLETCTTYPDGDRVEHRGWGTGGGYSMPEVVCCEYSSPPKQYDPSIRTRFCKDRPSEALPGAPCGPAAPAGPCAPATP